MTKKQKTRLLIARRRMQSHYATSQGAGKMQYATKHFLLCTTFLCVVLFFDLKTRDENEIFCYSSLVYKLLHIFRDLRPENGGPVGAVYAHAG